MDFDHLLAASVIRHGQPAAFAALVRLADRLRAAGSRSAGFRTQRISDEQSPEPWGELTKVLDEICTDRRVATAVRTLANDMFSRPVADHPQGFQRMGGTDYWRRFLSRPEIPKDECDQPILRAIRSFADSAVPRLEELVGGDEYWAHLEWFVSLIEPEWALRLLDCALGHAAASFTNADIEIPGGAHLLRIIIQRARP